MSKKKGRPPEGRDDITTKIDRRLAGMLKFVAGRRGLASAQLLDELIRIPLTRMYSQISRDIEAEILREDK